MFYFMLYDTYINHKKLCLCVLQDYKIESIKMKWCGKSWQQVTEDSVRCKISSALTSTAWPDCHSLQTQISWCSWASGLMAALSDSRGRQLGPSSLRYSRSAGDKRQHVTHEVLHVLNKKWVMGMGVL